MATNASMAQAWGNTCPNTRMGSPTIDRGHIHPPSIPKAMPRGGVTARVCSGVRATAATSRAAPVLTKAKATSRAATARGSPQSMRNNTTPATTMTAPWTRAMAKRPIAMPRRIVVMRKGALSMRRVMPSRRVPTIPAAAAVEVMNVNSTRLEGAV